MTQELTHKRDRKTSKEQVHHTSAGVEVRHQKLVHRSNSSRRSTHRLRTGRKAPRIQYRTEVWPPGPPFKRRDRVPPIAARCCKARLHSVFLAASVARAEVSEFEFIWSQLEPNPREEGSKIVGRKVPRSHLNRRYQPFQGWLLPELSADSAKLSSENLPNLVLPYWSQNGAKL